MPGLQGVIYSELTGVGYCYYKCNVGEVLKLNDIKIDSSQGVLIAISLKIPHCT